MEDFLGRFLTSYVLFPLIAFLLGGVVFLIAKKNKLMGNRKLITYALVTVLILVLPALTGFVEQYFIPYIYIALQLLYVVFGYYHLKAMDLFLPDFAQKPFKYEIIFTLVLCIMGMAFFSLVFNLCSELQYGWWASTCIVPFIFISLFRKTYRLYLDIPLEIYKIWEYSDDRKIADDSSIDTSELILVDIELFKQIGDPVPFHLSVQASDTMIFGNWFQRCIKDHSRKYPMSRIYYNDNEIPYGWIFYTKPSFFLPRRY
ncbi:TssN family type VI secretion system protein, partial [Bacteroides sp.]